MVDISPEAVLEYLKAHPDAAQTFFERLRAGAASAGPALASAYHQLGGVVDSIEALKKQSADAAKSFSNIISPEFLTTLKTLALGTDFKMIMTHIALIGGAIFSNIKPEAFEAMGEAARGANLDLNKTTETVVKMSQVFSALPGGEKLVSFAKGVNEFAKIAEPARQFEAGILMAASASGELGSMMEEIGEDMSGLESKMVTFTEMTNDIANAAGLSTAQVGKYASSLMQIPGALSTTVDITKDGTEQMHLLDAAIKVAAGTGQTFQKVFEDMNHVYREFGTNGQAAVQYVSRLSAASQSLKMPLDLVRTYTEGAARSFRFFGDNSNAAINILARFGPALKESGLGPQAIADLTKNITDNVANLGMAQRAFISQTAGGIGGLQGSFQIEMLKKQGRLDEVQKLVETSLRKQFGGRVVTLEEGARDAGAAAQLAKQVQLLTSGPTKIANTEAEAFRILDVMAKGGPPPAAEVIKPPEEALQSAVEKGNTFQERQYNSLVTLTNWAEKQTAFASISAANLTRLAGGREGLARRFVDETRTLGTEQAATRKLVGGGPEAPVEQSLNEALRFSETAGPKRFLDSLDKGFDELKTKQQLKMRGLAEPKPAETIEFPTPNFELPKPTGFLELPGSPLPSPRRQVAGAIGEPEATKLAGGPVGARGTNEALVTVEVTCQNCNAKVAEETSIRVVDSKIASVKKGDILQPFTGSHLG